MVITAIWTFCELDILRTGHSANWTFCELVILRTGLSANWTFRELDILQPLVILRIGQSAPKRLAIVFAVDKFHQYLYGRKFVLRTDHKPLVSIFGPNMGIPSAAASRLQRWEIKLSA